MFETVAPEKFQKRSRKALYEALPLSIAFHAAVAGGALIAGVWTIAFPQNSPAQVMSFTVSELPPPPPPPPPPPKPLQAQQVAVKPVEMPKEIVAPTVIPEEIPVIVPTTLVAAIADASPQGVEGGIPGGDIGGVIGGVSGGDIGGIIGGVTGGVVTEPDRVVVERDRPLPMYPLSQVYPAYPEEARLRAWEDQLVVRYVIGKDGRVKEVTIISPPERGIFAEPTIKAIRHWRFRPMIKDGERQEVVHELTVFYKLNQES
ncbi:MAG TPA: TonB family protein [Thermoanaerobaculia bacterium]